jgi:cell division protein FtsB
MEGHAPGTPIDSPPEPSAEKDALIASLRAQNEELSNRVAELQRLVAALRDEIAAPIILGLRDAVG